jgi:4-carboxymuconolactone decarboxylase
MGDREKHKRGLEVLDKLGWPRTVGAPGMDPKFWDFTVENLFGEIWARPGLSLRDRQIVTLAVLITLDAEEGVKPHFRAARNLGITEEEIREIIIQVLYYAGWPKGAHATLRFGKLLKELETQGESYNKTKKKKTTNKKAKK